MGPGDVHGDGMTDPHLSDEQLDALLDGGASFSDVIDQFELTAPDGADEYDTVAGYVLAALGRIPEVGDRVAISDAELRVRELNERRITSLELLVTAGRPQPPDRQAPGSSD